MRSNLPALVLEDCQLDAVERMVAEPSRAALNASLMGTGKTLMAVEVAKRIQADTILVVGPLNTFWGWFDTIQRQNGYNQTISKINSTKDGRAAYEDLKAGKPGWYFVGREYFRSKEWFKVVPQMVIVDECHFAQNRASKSFRVLKTLKAGYKLSLSGTPSGNKFDGFWAVSRYLWNDTNIVDRSFWKWVEKYAKTVYSPFAGVEVQGEKIPGKFVSSLPCYVRLEPNHNLEVVEETRFVDLVAAQRRIYDKFERDLVVFLEDNPMIAEVPIAARIRLRQITLAVPSIGESDEIFFADDAVSTKFKALQEILDDNPDEKILILTDSQKYAKIVAQRIGVKAFEWSGRASQNQREQAKAAFMGDGLQYVVAVIPAIAEGVDGLQDVCSTIVWLSHSDNGLMNQQVVDRIRRRGQKSVVKIYDIVARDTYDEGQLSSLVERQLQMNATLRKGE